MGTLMGFPIIYLGGLIWAAAPLLKRSKKHDRTL